ncbi:MAG: universal stress protein [Bacteroidales bacterium]
MKLKKINKVLIALDYDPTARIVAEKGYLFAKSMGAEVILMHVLLDLAYYSLEYLYKDPMKLSAVEELNQISLAYLEKTKLRLNDKKIQILVKEGDFADSILATAIELDADFIIMGSHSKNWFGDIVMGSVTEKVLKNTSIPLLIIPIKKLQ